MENRNVRSVPPMLSRRKCSSWRTPGLQRPLDRTSAAICFSGDSLSLSLLTELLRQAIEDFSNKYYSTIPHVFGRGTPPLIDNDAILRREVAMLDTLSDMEVANAIMKATTGKSRDDESVNLLDKRFKDLGMEEMTPLNRESREYRELSKYLIESSGQTHNLRYRLEDIFRIKRQGEDNRFETSKFAKLKDKNRRLLWHGSRTTNFGGILSQGLRIAPPEAPVNGYAFGKGVYLADVSTKSANYCNPSMSGNVGLLLLCEVELSRPMYEIPTGNSNAQQEAERHNCISTMGVGRTVPQAWKDAGCVHESLKGVLMVSWNVRV
jgi:poly [ADP-ribose] polymerase